MLQRVTFCRNYMQHVQKLTDKLSNQLQWQAAKKKRLALANCTDSVVDIRPAAVVVQKTHACQVSEQHPTLNHLKRQQSGTQTHSFTPAVIRRPAESKPTEHEQNRVMVKSLIMTIFHHFIFYRNIGIITYTIIKMIKFY